MIHPVSSQALPSFFWYNSGTDPNSIPQPHSAVHSVLPRNIHENKQVKLISGIHHLPLRIRTYAASDRRSQVLLPAFPPIGSCARGLLRAAPAALLHLISEDISAPKNDYPPIFSQQNMYTQQVVLLIHIHWISMIQQSSLES
mgnify:CR=1 FL=1